MTTYAERFTRFFAAALALGLLISIMTLAYRVTPTASVGSGWVTQVMPSVRITASLFGKGLLFAMPLALLLGLPAGLRPGTRLDRGLLMPLALIAGIPIPTLTMLLFYPLDLRRPILDMQQVAVATIALVGLAALAPAIRTAAASAGARFPERALAVLGSVLQQAGTLVVAICVMEFFYPLRGGLYRLLEGSVRAQNYPGVIVSFTLLVLPVLFLHLAGDLCVTWSQRKAPAHGSGSHIGGWLLLGSLLAIVLAAIALWSFAEPKAVAAEKSLPPSAEHRLGTDSRGRDLSALLGVSSRNAIVHAATVTCAALMVGSLFGIAGARTGRWGAILLAPEISAPSQFAPFLALLASALLVRGTDWVTVLLAGAACAPPLACRFRGLIATPRGPARRGLLMASAGTAVLIFSQVMPAEMAAGGFQTFRSGTGLYAIIIATLGLNTHPYQFLPTVLVAVGTAGLYLVGTSLQTVARTGQPSVENYSEA